MVHLPKERTITFENNFKHKLIWVIHLYFPQGKNNKIDCNQDCLVRQKEKGSSGAWWTTFLYSFWEIILSSLFYRSTYDSWTMRCRIQMNAKGILWRCMMEAAPWRIWKPSSAAPWPMTSCSVQVSGSSACGRTRAVATAGFRCSSHPFKNVRISALHCLSFECVRWCQSHKLLMVFSSCSLSTAGCALVSCSRRWDSLSFALVQGQESHLWPFDYLYRHMHHSLG